MKKGEGRRPPPLFSYFVLEVSAGYLHVWAEGEGSVESRASRNDFETSRQPIRPQWGWNTWKRCRAFTVARWLIVRILASVSWILIDRIEMSLGWGKRVRSLSLYFCKSTLVRYKISFRSRLWKVYGNGREKFWINLANGFSVQFEDLWYTRHSFCKWASCFPTKKETSKEWFL